MGRLLIILVLMWAIALGGYMLFRDTPKTSSGYGLRDFFWVFLLTTSVVLVLGIVAMLTGVFSVG